MVGMRAGRESSAAKVAAAAVLTAAVAVAIVFGASTQGAAHGATSNPPSRVYTCRFEQPNNPMCAAAWSQNSQALYDWMEVNIGDADGRHQQLIPDGQLCSAGKDKYAALDAVSGSWPITDMRSSSRGLYRLQYTATAPHATAYFRFYLTKSGFNPATSSLGWSDLELVYDSGPAPAQSSYSWDVPLPARSGHHILYTIWQRSDSPEAFYSCSDIRLLGSGGGLDQPDGDLTTLTTASVSTKVPTTAPTTGATTPATTAVSSSTTGSPGSATTTINTATSGSSTSLSSSTSSSSTTEPIPTEAQDGDQEQAIVTLVPASSTTLGQEELDAPSGLVEAPLTGLAPGNDASLGPARGLDQDEIIAYGSLALSGLMALAGLLILGWDRRPISGRRR